MTALYDCLVIGGGPAGITAALYLLRAGFSLAWAEKLAPGGQMLNTERIDNYPGFPEGILGWELSELFERHLKPFSCDRFSDEVLKVDLKGKIKTASVGDQDVSARTVIVATGANWKKLGAPGENQLAGRGVSYCAVCDGNFFRGQEVICIGGGNTALEESLYLARIVSKVHLVHRRDRFRGDRIYQDKVAREPKIVPHMDTVVTSFVGENGLTGVDLKNVVTDERSHLEVNGAFIFIGLKPATGFLPSDLERDEDGFLKTDQEMATNIDGVFAAGDVRSKRCRQVTSAVGDGAVAAYAATEFIERTNV
ncbi:MAG: thioredoxin-disulfide reductase [Deltaproteobacteria bacterium]|nr:thioredoxin-disulfide reductase [Deltaproteobacteria bacterium]